MSVQQTGGQPAAETVVEAMRESGALPPWKVPEAKEATLHLPGGATLRVSAFQLDCTNFRRGFYISDHVSETTLSSACESAPGAFAAMLRTLAEELEKYA